MKNREERDTYRDELLYEYQMVLEFYDDLNMLREQAKPEDKATYNALRMLVQQIFPLLRKLIEGLEDLEIKDIIKKAP